MKFEDGIYFYALLKMLHVDGRTTCVERLPTAFHQCEWSCARCRMSMSFLQLCSCTFIANSKPIYHCWISEMTFPSRVVDFKDQSYMCIGNQFLIIYKCKGSTDTSHIHGILSLSAPTSSMLSGASLYMLTPFAQLTGAIPHVYSHEIVNSRTICSNSTYGM